MTENEAIFKLKRPPYEVWQYGMADLGWNNAVEFAISSLEEIQQYRAIGTVDECREARERQEPMCLNDRETPFIGKSTKIQFRCPQCGIILGIGISKKPIIQKEIRHCYNCGQKLYR